MTTEQAFSDDILPSIEERDSQEAELESSKIFGFSEIDPFILASGNKSYTARLIGPDFYNDPLDYKIASGINVLLHVAETGNLEEERNKNYLEHLLATNNEIVVYQKKIMEYQENMLQTSKDRHDELLAKLDRLSSDLKDAENKLKEAIDSKYLLSEGDIIRSIKESPAEYTIVFSKVLLILTVALLAAYYFLDVKIVNPIFLYSGIITFLTFFIMGKRGVSNES